MQLWFLILDILEVPPTSMATRFDSSMFPSGGASVTASPLSTSGPPEDGSTGHGKPHKAKKKKKKQKHKHKHKHKHDKEKRDDDEKLKTVSTGIILGHPLSSDASAANSPATHNAASSPEYEVI